MQQESVQIPAEIAEEEAHIGRIVSVTGSQAVVLLDHEAEGAEAEASRRAELCEVLKIDTPTSVLLGLVSAMSIPVPSQSDGQPEVRIAELELLGQILKDEQGHIGDFQRGVSTYPSLGDKVYRAGGEDLRRAYLSNSAQAVQIGTLRQDMSIPAMIHVDELLGKHCAILGSTGTGKSCGVAMILRAILAQNPQAHVLLLDPHNEYASSFGDKAEVITPRDLQLPFWFLTFEEMVEVVIGDAPGKDVEVEILAELIPLAKTRFAANRGRDDGLLKKGVGTVDVFTVDTPVPYRISDLLALIEERVGRFENRKDLIPYRQLRSRLESISWDPRYAFMFGNLTVQDHMADIVGRMFRVPVNDKPIAILELTGVPSEIVNVVVSLICRMTFDFALWGDGNVPVTLVCEEAHRYVPNNPKLGFEPTRRAIARIAKEGRKYGVSLCVISQRPSELDSTILSQCNTVFAMRMSNDRDQAFVRAAIFDTAASLLDFLPSMGMREAIVFGDGVTLPGRIRFGDVPEEAMPRGRTASFTTKWRDADKNTDYLQEVVSRWRAAGSPESFHPIPGDFGEEVHGGAQMHMPEHAMAVDDDYGVGQVPVIDSGAPTLDPGRPPQDMGPHGTGAQPAATVPPAPPTHPAE